MSRLSTIPPEYANGQAGELFGRIKKSAGRVPNLYTTIGTHDPDALAAILAFDGVVNDGSLPKADVEVIKLAVSEVAGCDYCLAAHTLLGRAAGLSSETMKQVRRGEPSGDARRDELVRFVRELVETSGTLSPSALESLLAVGYSEHQVMHICLAIASITFTNLVNRINDTTLDFPAVQ